MGKTTTAPQAHNRWAFLALLGAFLLLTLALAAPAFAARTPFDGGPIVTDTSTTAANDHTVYAMRFAATTGGSYPLKASTTYYVKVRFSTDTATGLPSSGNNRGFVWNGSTWVQEADSDWTKFPQVTTSPAGAIAQSPWIYYKFGDTTKADSYALIVSLSEVGSTSSTLNGTSWINVNVFNPATAGGWVHDGVDNSASANKRADIVDHASPGNPLALTFTEKNLVDDDSNGTVDDEQYGPVQNGGFRMSVPMSQALDIRMQKAVWPAQPSGFTLAIADTDIALGATDQSAPTAPGTPTAAARNAGAVLTWSAATDDTAVTAYTVYRWTDVTPGSSYTAIPAKVATVTDGTSFTDSGLTNGTTYHYMVRAVDVATNVGPRSATADVTPAIGTLLTLTATPRIVSWGQPWQLSGTLRTAAGEVIPDTGVELQKSTNSGIMWTPVTALDPASPGTSDYSHSEAAPGQKTQYRLVFAGDAAHLGSQSGPVTVTPRVKLGRPVAPSIVKKRTTFSVYGSLAPRQASGSKTVTIKCYLRKSGKWVFKKTVAATNSNDGSASRYKARFSLPYAGSWNLIALTVSTAKYSATVSSSEYLRAK